MGKKLVKQRKLVGQSHRRTTSNEGQSSFIERMYRKGLQGMVAGTIKEQLKLPAGTADHGIHGFVGGYLEPKQYKSLRRGVKIRMTAVGMDSSTMTDKELKSILKDLKIDVPSEPWTKSGRNEWTHPDKPHFKISLEKIEREGDYGERDMPFVNVVLRRGKKWALIGSTVTIREAKSVAKDFMDNEDVDAFWNNADIYD